MIIDATDLILGRMATVAAKKALLGEKIIIINSEKAFITGKKKKLIEKAKNAKERGTPKGPLISKMPDRYVKRAIRGMLPYKKDKGRKALKNIICYIGVPEKIEKEKAETIKEANIGKAQTYNYLTVGQICKQLGAKI
jgi:large subunit ribosomal protein L13